MGYESKIFVVERCEYNDGCGACAFPVASFDLCKMGHNDKEFFAAFKREIDYALFLPVSDKDGNSVVQAVNEDCYGEHMKAADLQDLIDALKISEQRDHYRRLPPLIAMLEALVAERDDWYSETERLEAVHYGY